MYKAGREIDSRIENYSKLKILSVLLPCNKCSKWQADSNFHFSSKRCIIWDMLIEYVDNKRKFRHLSTILLVKKLGHSSINFN